MAKKADKPKKKPDPEFMIRVRLPSSSAYPSCPSGDTDYEHDRHVAIAAVMPEGFGLVPERPGTANPRDSEGYTYLRIRCLDDTAWFGSMKRRMEAAEKKLQRLREIMDE